MSVVGPSIASDVQKLEPGALVDLYAIDASNIGGFLVRIHPGTHVNQGSIIWQGFEFEPYPIKVSGFEWTGRGTLPRPTVLVANIQGLISALCLAYSDMVGARVIRKRTFARYLDAVNFPGGNPSADPNACFPDEVYYIDRKASEGKVMVEFELAASFDVQGVQLPRRQIIQNLCVWKYRSAECSYAGGPVAKADDTPTTVFAQDVCGKRLSSCKMRFGAAAPLPYGGEPAVGLIR